ncbi:hypothetical protein GFL93_12645 [Rhizobium leguminosarum bv. viciae]|jgi:hypothetical protein|uniref:hypothetical protein n=1 Tax=Rhizobium TaxID=379 RepID=UPI0014411BD0|nr:hypothetical protein [Rhizobium leguminosarum]NKK06709.1 hypothetical protein [Rhizobium leguminosarum bv. viciae]
MPDIHFTQYLMPDGRPSDVRIDRPDHIAEKAQEILSKGFKFECEMLSDYRTISLTITHPKDGDLEIEVVPNGPEVPVAIDRMIERFAASHAA